jgi:aspartyl-tRNA(Asn)/glutamyl-tRNA(Gln) amidotransferase subunit C
LKTVIDRQMVRHVAALARLQVNEADLDRLTQQMSDIVGYVEKLNELDLAAVEPTSHAVDLLGALQDDAVRPGLAPRDLFGNAPDSLPPFVRVPKIVEGGGEA